MSGKKYLVYKHTNKVNGLVYIGITCQKPKRRWKNGKGYIGNEYFWEDIEKYGWNGFNHLILVRGLTKEEAKWLEIQLIAAYDSTDRGKGYNISKGGDIISEETRQKISKSNTGKHPSEETKRKLSELNKGKTGSKCHNSKTVICITTKQVFYGAVEAGKMTGVCYSCISEVCNGNRKSAGKLPDGTKLRWKFVKDLPKPKVSEDKKQLLRNGPKPLKIVC